MANCSTFNGGDFTAAIAKAPVPVTCSVATVKADKETKDWLNKTLVDANGKRKPDVPAAVERYLVKIAAQQAAISAACSPPKEKK